MKYIVILGDGMAGEPMETLGGKTTLEAAVTPNMDSLAAMGEIGLAGEFRTISSADQRAAEAARLGFTKIALPKRCIDGKMAAGGIDLIPLGGIYDALTLLAKKE